MLRTAENRIVIRKNQHKIKQSDKKTINNIEYSKPT